MKNAAFVSKDFSKFECRIFPTPFFLNLKYAALLSYFVNSYKGNTRKVKGMVNEPDMVTFPFTNRLSLVSTGIIPTPITHTLTYTFTRRNRALVFLY